MKRKKKFFYTRLLKESHHTLAWPAKLSCPLRKSLPTNGNEMSKTNETNKQKKTIRQKRNEKKAKMNEETFKSKTNLCSLRELRTFSKDKKLGT